MNNVRVHSLYIYPIKSLQGIKLEQADLTKRGFKYDRHWMLIDEQGRFLSQRECADMAKIHTKLEKNHLRVSADPVAEDLLIPLNDHQETQLTVTIWGDTCNATQVSLQANLWFSELLRMHCKLVYLPQKEIRQVDPNHAKNNEQVGFADGYPLLVVSLESLKQLNTKLSSPVDITQFRPNIVIENCEAHAEDNWENIQINGIDILLPKPCSRCNIPAINQQTAEPVPDMLKTLASYRRKDRKILFGMNGLHQTTGQINCRDEVIINI